MAGAGRSRTQLTTLRRRGSFFPASIDSRYRITARVGMCRPRSSIAGWARDCLHRSLRDRNASTPSRAPQRKIPTTRERQSSARSFTAGPRFIRTRAWASASPAEQHRPALGGRRWQRVSTQRTKRRGESRVRGRGVPARTHHRTTSESESTSRHGLCSGLSGSRSRIQGSYEGNSRTDRVKHSRGPSARGPKGPQPGRS